VDDREFAAFWIENRERFNPRSARAMTVELRQLGVDRETAEAAIAPERDAERAVTAGERKLYALRGLDFDHFRERMGAFLLRRGFSYEVARVAVRELWARTGGDAASEDEAE
jgi:regulatory protein